MTLIILPGWPATRQIVSWLYLDGHPAKKPWESKDMINREYFRELIKHLSKN